MANELIAEIVVDTEQMDRSLKLIRGGLDQLAKDAKRAGKELDDSFGKQKKTVDQTKSSIDSAAASIGKLRLGVLGGVAAVATLGAGIIKATQAFSEYELAAKRLQGALTAVGITSPAVTKHFLDLANGLQQTTKYSDDTIVNLQTMLLNMGVLPSQLEAVTRTTLDTASAFGKDVDTVGSAIAKAMQGYGDQLGRIIPSMRNLTEEQLKAGKALDILSSKFAGQASKDLDTFAGKLENIKNIIGDIFKTLGGAIAGFLAKSGFLKDWQEVFQSLQSTVKNVVGETAVGGTEMAKASKEATKEIKNQLAAADKLIIQQQKEQELAKKKIELTKEFSALQDELQKIDPAEAIHREHDARLKLINDVAKAEAASARDIADVRLRIEKDFQRQVNELKEKEDADALKMDKINQEKKLEGLKSVQKGLQIGEGASQGGLGAVGAGVGAIFGGAAGAEIGGQIGGSLVGLSANLAKSLPTLFSDIFAQLGDVISNLFEGITGFFSSFGGLFGGGRDFQKDLASAIGDAMDSTEFAKQMQNLIDSLDSTAAQFRSTGQQLAAALQSPGGNIKGAVAGIFDQIRLRGNFAGSGSNITEILAAGTTADQLKGAEVKIRDPEKMAAALKELDEALQQEAQRIASITNLRIQLAQEEAQALIDLNNKALKPIQENIAKLASAESAINLAVDQVKGTIAGPEATLASLQAQFASAKGGAKGEVAVQVKDALLQKLQAVQNLAAAGAIGGEQLQIEQANILTQLQDLQKQTQTELSKQEAKEKKLLEANEKIQSELEKQTDLMKATAEKQISQLQEIAKQLKDGNVVEFIKSGGKFQHGTEFVPKTGFHLLHQGEVIVSPENRTQGGFGNVTLMVNGSFGGGDNFVEQLISAIKLNKGNIIQQIQKKVG